MSSNRARVDFLAVTSSVNEKSVFKKFNLKNRFLTLWFEMTKR
jgi:hypothetical protein